MFRVELIVFAFIHLRMQECGELNFTNTEISMKVCQEL